MSLLKNITIKNFRSIEELSINLSSNYIVLTGENNTGKSNILKALSLQNNRSYHELEKNEMRVSYFDEQTNIEISTLFANRKSNTFMQTTLKDNSEIIDKENNNCIYIGFSPFITTVNDQSIEIDNRDLHHFDLGAKIKSMINELNKITKIERDEDRFREIMDIEENGFDSDPQYAFQKAVKLSHIPKFSVPLKSNGFGIQKKELLQKVLETIVNTSKDIRRGHQDHHVSIIIGIDEPENSLHPYLQKEIAQLMQDPKYNFITFIIATHSYHFLNYKDPSSNFLVSREDNKTKIKNGNFEEICTALGYPYPNEQEVWHKIFTTNKDNIFIVEGETDKQHVENCIELFPNELVPLFQKWEIVSADSATKIPFLIRVCKKLGKSQINGIVDNDKEGIEFQGEYLNVLPLKGTIEENTHKPNDFTTETLERKWAEFDSQKTNKELYEKCLKTEKE